MKKDTHFTLRALPSAIEHFLCFRTFLKFYTECK